MRRRKGAALAAALLAAMPAAAMAGVTVERSNGGVATVARMPIAPRLSFKAHVGAVPDSGAPAASQPLWLGGAGIEYRITRRLVLGAGWERHSAAGNANSIDLGLDPRRHPGTVDPDRVTVGLSYRF